jgi:hypothetical protein
MRSRLPAGSSEARANTVGAARPWLKPIGDLSEVVFSVVRPAIAAACGWQIDGLEIRLEQSPIDARQGVPTVDLSFELAGAARRPRIIQAMKPL